MDLITTQQTRRNNIPNEVTTVNRRENVLEVIDLTLPSDSDEDSGKC